MGRHLARVVVTLIAAMLLLVGGVAGAERGGPAVRLPVEPARSGDRFVLVEPGDHLWKISSEALAAYLGRDPDNDEVSPYWRRVIAENRDRLRSGDPDLIYPGETVLLPVSH